MSVSVTASASVASPEELPATQSATATTAYVVIVGPKCQFGKAWVPISLDNKVNKYRAMSSVRLCESYFRQATRWCTYRMIS